MKKTDRNGRPIQVVTTSKIRNLLAMTADIYNDVVNSNSEKLSQQEFADMLDVSRITVARWESGKNSPSSAQLAKICKVFKLDYTRLMDSSDEVPYINEPETPNSTGAEDSEEHAEAESSGCHSHPCMIGTECTRGTALLISY